MAELGEVTGVFRLNKSVSYSEATCSQTFELTPAPNQELQLGHLDFCFHRRTHHIGSGKWGKSMLLRVPSGFATPYGNRRGGGVADIHDSGQIYVASSSPVACLNSSQFSIPFAEPTALLKSWTSVLLLEGGLISKLPDVLWIQDYSSRYRMKESTVVFSQILQSKQPQITKNRVRVRLMFRSLAEHFKPLLVSQNGQSKNFDPDKAFKFFKPRHEDSKTCCSIQKRCQRFLALSHCRLL